MRHLMMTEEKQRTISRYLPTNTLLNNEPTHLVQFESISNITTTQVYS